MQNKSSNNIILVGFMGCGKSTIGRELASRLNRSFLDTDEEIEKKEGRTITQIFNEQGEEGFRKVEEEYINSLNVSDSIIAVGGGMPCYKNNMEVLNDLGTTIYIQVEVEELFQRLRKDNEDRPLLAKMNDAELKSFIQQKLAIREKDYLKASKLFSSIEELL